MAGEVVFIWDKSWGEGLDPEGNWARAWAFPDKIVIYATDKVEPEWIGDLLTHEVLHQVLMSFGIKGLHIYLDNIHDWSWKTKAYEFHEGKKE